jgi:hypothetical protein
MFGSRVLAVPVGLLMFSLLLRLNCAGAMGAVLAFLLVKQRKPVRGMRQVQAVAKDPGRTHRLLNYPLVKSLGGGRPAWLAVGVRRPTPQVPLSVVPVRSVHCCCFATSVLMNCAPCRGGPSVTDPTLWPSPTSR